MKPFTDERLIKANQQRLDALDRLSLHFCLGANEDITIEGVPLDDEGREADWQLRVAGENQYTLDPYPFRREPLEFAILARRIARRRYTDEADLQKVLAAAPFYNIRLTLRPGAVKDEFFAVSA
jgi:hypothetical protein